MDCFRKRRLSRSNPYIIGALKNLPGTPREFQLKDLEKATNKFDEKMMVGEGAFGVVYKGYLAKEDMEVAVKMFGKERTRVLDDFFQELTIIYQLRHKHLVRLLGWCHKHGKLLLVYNYMHNGSLDKHLFSDADNKPLSWNLRYKIISEVASALHYLHNEFDVRVVHRQIKAKNIMLDSEFNVRLGSLGLTRALHKEETSYEAVEGPVGYLAPESSRSGKFNELSDVYSFGVLLLEVVCGRRPIVVNDGEYPFIVDWVQAMHHKYQLLEVVDKRLGEDYVVEEAQRNLLLGLACSNPIASERPRTREIVQILLGLVALPQVPPFKLAFVSASRPMEEENISLSDGEEYNSLTINSDGSERN